MSVTFTLQTTMTGGGMSSLGGSGEETGTAPGGIDASFAAGSINAIQTTAFVVADLKAFLLKSDQPMTLSTNGTNAVKQIATTGTVTSGTFTETVNGQTTTAIQWNSSAAAMQTILEALSNVAPGDVACTGGPLPATPIAVAFSANLGNQAITLTTTDTLTGGSTAVSNVTVGVTPDNSFAMKANRPFSWSLSDGYFANPFTMNVVRFNVTCTTSARLQGRILT